jgi:hypothetical protein
MTRSQFDARMAFIRRYALAHTGRDDDATCFAIAVLFWMGSEQDGFHYAKPDRHVELELDDQEIVQ